MGRVSYAATDEERRARLATFRPLQRVHAMAIQGAAGQELRASVGEEKQLGNNEIRLKEGNLSAKREARAREVERARSRA